MKMWSNATMKVSLSVTDNLELLNNYSDIRSEIVALLQAARAASVRSVNALMTATYWEIGRRIVEFEQQGEQRAEYGETLIRQPNFMSASRSPRIKPPC